MPAADALAAAGLTPVELGAKEGLALINGTDGMLGMLVLAITDLRMLLRTADIAAAMSVEGAAGHRPGLRRRAPGAAAAARPGRCRPPTWRALLAGSGVVAAHRGRRLQPGAGRLLAALLARRCTAPPATPSSTPRRSPVASWPRRSTTRWCWRTRAGSSPTATSTARPVAYVLDFLAIVAADVASISERRTDRFLDRARNHGLPPFLADDPGVDSGLMIAQYTQAAIVSELKRLAVPGQRRLDPLQRDAGGPRLDGLVGRPQAAPVRRRADPRRRDRGAHRRPRASTCAPHRSSRRPAPATGAVVRLLRAHGVEGPGPTATCRPRSRPPSTLVARVPSCAAVEAEIGELA